MFLNIFKNTQNDDSIIDNPIYRNIYDYNLELNVSKNEEIIKNIIYNMLKKQLLEIYAVYVDPYSDREENISAQNAEGHICLKAKNILKMMLDKNIIENTEINIIAKIGYDDYRSNSSKELKYKSFTYSFLI